MQIIFFDVDGVLIDGYHFRPELRKLWHKDLKADYGFEPEYFSGSFFVDHFLAEVLRGKKPLEDALSEWFAQEGRADINVDEFMQYWLEKDSTLNAQLIESIKKLKNSGQVRLFIATNQAPNRAHYLMHDLGLKDLFEDMFYSSDIGAIKPELAYFEHIRDTLGLTPDDRPILFDDTPKVIEAAKNFGWDAYEFLTAESVHDCAFVRDILKGVEGWY
ncbi:MAG: HAD family hydrolase [Pseudobdellovibrionaceae bacterium]|nr:HAD family hydrolase [Pseudobdellovibrionaceae bacterium]